MVLEVGIVSCFVGLGVDYGVLIELRWGLGDGWVIIQYNDYQINLNCLCYDFRCELFPLKSH